MKNKNNFFDKEKNKKPQKNLYNDKYPIFEIIKYNNSNKQKNRKERKETIRAILYENQFYKIDIKYPNITFMDFELKPYKNIDITDLDCKLKRIPYKEYSTLEKLFAEFTEKGISKIIKKNY